MGEPACPHCRALQAEAERLGKLGLKMKGERDAALRRVRELEAVLALYRPPDPANPMKSFLDGLFRRG